MSGKFENNMLLILFELIFYSGLLVMLIWYFLPRALR
jgi:hypothetical protein